MDVIIDVLGANAMPLLVGVTISGDTKTFEVTRTVLVTCVDVTAGDLGKDTVGVSTWLEVVGDELVLAGSAEIEGEDVAGSLCRTADEVTIGEGFAEGLGVESEGDVVSVVALSEGPLPSLGQPERSHGSTEQQPLKPFELHV